MFTNLYANNIHDNIFAADVVLILMKRTWNVFVRFFCLLVVILNLQCKKTSQSLASENEQINDSFTLTEQDITDFGIIEFALSDQAEKVTENWLKLLEFATHMEGLKKGQLSFFKDDKTIMQGLITDLKAEIPEAINKSSILARITVLETTMNKLDEVANIRSTTKDTLLNNIKDLFQSYNNLIYQINKEVERDSQKIIKP